MERSFPVLTVVVSSEATQSGKYHKPSAMQKRWNSASDGRKKVLKQAGKVRETSQFSPVIQRDPAAATASQTPSRYLLQRSLSRPSLHIKRLISYK